MDDELFVGIRRDALPCRDVRIKDEVWKENAEGREYVRCFPVIPCSKDGLGRACFRLVQRANMLDVDVFKEREFRAAIWRVERMVASAGRASAAVYMVWHRCCCYSYSIDVQPALASPRFDPDLASQASTMVPSTCTPPIISQSVLVILCSTL